MNTMSMLSRAQRILIATVAAVLAVAFAISANVALSATSHDGSSDRAATKEWKGNKDVVSARTKEWKSDTNVVVATKEWKASVTVK